MKENWIPATQRLPGANQKVRMKWTDNDPQSGWDGDIFAELAEVKPEAKHKLLWLDTFGEPDPELNEEEFWVQIERALSYIIKRKT